MVIDDGDDGKQDSSGSSSHEDEPPVSKCPFVKTARVAVNDDEEGIEEEEEDSGHEQHEDLLEHKAVKMKLLPLSTKTQHLHGISSQSALSINMPTPAPSADVVSSTAFVKIPEVDDDFKRAMLAPEKLNSSQLHRRSYQKPTNRVRRPWTWNLQQAFYRLFEPRDRAEKSRIVKAGDAKFNAKFKYCDNSIKTSRYNIFTFIPLNLFEQFLRTANIYFLILVFLQAIPTISAVGPLPKAIALSVVIGITAIRQAVDDFLRYRSDQRINNRKATVITPNETLKTVSWRQIRVGQILRLANNESVPADMILLSSSEPTGLCYIETAELDGETNLKYRQAPPETHHILGENLKRLVTFDGQIQCDAPNNHLTRFTGCLDWQEQSHALNNINVLYRGCTVRNTDWVYGVVIYTGRQTKLMKNAGKTLYKRTRVEKLSNKFFLGLFAIMVVLLLTSAISGYFFEDGIGRQFKEIGYGLWMQIDDINPAGIAFLQCLSYLILVQQLLPITLYTTIELINIFLSRGFINGDKEMYHADTDTKAQARSTSLNEDLGQIEYIFSDKTGTLTRNVMTFNKCSVGGREYGGGNEKSQQQPVDFSKHEPKYCEPSFKFYDERLLDEVRDGSEEVREFFLLLALCHTLNAENDPETGRLVYKAQSPDEAALVTAARHFGYVFKSRTHSSITLVVFGRPVTYQLLCTLEFDTTRKRMGVVVVDHQTGRRRLLCKGADSAILSLVNEKTPTIGATKQHLHEFACSGLRTLCCASRDIDDAEWAGWFEKYQSACKAMDNREELIYDCCLAIEKDLTLVGATAVEDKLQNGVPETIANLTQAGIKIWVLTGDKQETAINIGQSCNMLKETTQELIIDAECFPGVEQQLNEALERIERRQRMDSLRNVVSNSSKGLQMLANGSLKKSKGDKKEFALIISGHSLFYALTEQLEELFLNVACQCQTVICCRVAPLQKGRVVELVRRRKKAMTLAIGDGGNDVNMIRTAHIGVGISGNEGMQAVLSSDYSLAQFRFLQRLLLVHGRWNYLRMSTFLNFFFYKTLAFATCQFWFGIFCGWSGMSVYDQWFITAYTLVYTSSPLLYFTLCEQDVNEYYSQAFPKLYWPGLKGSYFNLIRFVLSKTEGILTSLVAFFMLRYAFSDFNYPTGDPITTSRAAISIALGTLLVIIVTVRCCLETSYWAVVNIWPACSLIACFLIQYLIAIVVTKVKKGFDSESIGIAYAVWTSPNFWLVSFVSVTICCLPVLFVRLYNNIMKPNLLYRVRLLQNAEGKTWKDYKQVNPNEVSTEAYENSSLRCRKLSGNPLA